MSSYQRIHRFLYAHLSRIGRILVNAYLSRTELSFVKSAVTQLKTILFSFGVFGNEHFTQHSC